jgi:hypothetical protein
MSLSIPALNSTSLIHGVLIRITVNNQVYRIANTYGPIVYNGETYLALGHFLGMNEIQDDIRSTNNQLQISLSGIPVGTENPASYIALMLDNPIKGSRVEVYRAFFDQTTRQFLSNQTSLRFSGYISSFTITDGADTEARRDTRTVVVNCSSVHAIIEKRITGRRTNQTDQRALYPDDVSMDRVVAISNASFDFGKPYAGGGTGAPVVDTGGGQQFDA